MELWQLDATDLARLIRNGRASAVEAVDAVLKRLHKVNPAINAVVRVYEEEARTAAETADAARARGHALPPLHGVPVTVKINVDVAGQPTDNGVTALKDLIATEDSPVVANLRHAGAIIIGRTNAPAFSMRIFSDNALHGRTLNPRDPGVTPGGSSGGAGAATATGIGAIAHGNDIGGSVRIPAYCNGVVGLRTGFARIPSFNPTSANVGRPIGAVLMAVQGPHTRTVRDARLALEVMARGDRRDWRWNDVPMQGPPPARPIKAAIVPEFPGARTHPAQAAAVRQAGKHLQAAGYVVEEVLPPDLERGVELWHMICVTDVFGGLWPQMQKMGDPDGIAAMRAWLELHKPVDLATYVAALTEREGMLFRWMSFLQQWPLVILPTLADLPPRQVADVTVEGQRQVLDSMRPALIAPLLGLPGLAIPVGSHGRLRTGVQIMAMRNREDLCLDAGEVIEAAEGVVTPIDPAAA
ncbi:amidase [Enhydrobacter sp.]|jgi:amidase|uniref:amidase n=1 Tax=Enhydrobacter sp. TaxID=1894999 RepID=UPI00262535FB|nr:amidase [Enhydrobacter sp.]WIM14087.1 MAG: amidase family protein [Enhydrobacter sp.]